MDISIHRIHTHPSAKQSLVGSLYHIQGSDPPLVENQMHGANLLSTSTCVGVISTDTS